MPAKGPGRIPARLSERTSARLASRASARLSARLSSEDRREQILDAAIPLFARHGFNGTTTRQIAKRAAVNEAIIFRHFPTKQELYWAIIERKCTSSDRRRMIQEKLCSGAGELEIFTDIARQMLERTRNDQNVTRLLLFSSLERHELSERFFRTYVAEVFDALADYIRGRIEAGVFRATDPVLSARSFLGMVVYHNWIQELFGGSKMHRYDSAEVARTVAEMWLRGIQVRPGAGSNLTRPNGSAHSNGNGNGAKRAQQRNGAK